MGMLAAYQEIKKEDFKTLSESDDFFETLEDLEEKDGTELCNIDKMWDALHFVLTGVSASEPIKDNCFSEAILGISPIEEVEEYVAYTEKSRIKNIVLALDNFDIEKAMESFSMEECKKANIYPNIWDYEEESEEIEEELMDYFQNMKDFYKKILEAKGNVLVTIC